MRVAVIQMNSGNNKEKNIKHAVAMVRKAIKGKAEFILLPEVFNFRGQGNLKKNFASVPESFPGLATIPLMELAKKHRVSILAGSLYEKTSRKRKPFNASVLIGRDGSIAAKYRKVHLFDAQIGQKKVNESRIFSRGRRRVVADVGGWTLGMSICYDLRFPEFYQKYQQAGVDVFCVPSAFTLATGRAHWEVLLRARAIENLCYVLAPNQIGVDGSGVRSYGNSMIIDPWGKVLARASSNKEEIIYTKLDRKVLKRCKAMLPDENSEY